MDNDAQLFVDRFLQFHVETGVTPVGAVGMVGSLLQSGQFLCSKFKFVCWQQHDIQGASDITVGVCHLTVMGCPSMWWRKEGASPSTWFVLVLWRILICCNASHVTC